jgi:hypothetical protein
LLALLKVNLGAQFVRFLDGAVSVILFVCSHNSDCEIPEGSSYRT